MNNDKSLLKKLSIWIGIIASICTVLGFTNSLFNLSNSPTSVTKTDNDNNNVNINGDNTIIVNSGVILWNILKPYVINVDIL